SEGFRAWQIRRSIEDYESLMGREAADRDVVAQLALLVIAWFGLAWLVLGRRAPPAARAERVRRDLRVAATSALVLAPFAIPIVVVATHPDASGILEAVAFERIRNVVPASVLGGFALIASMVAVALVVLSRRIRFAEVPLHSLDERTPGARTLLDA
ncbi:MAG TPA: hypothetical protein VKE69_04735, partial [Planctomycetota bacterium]|nr:hypothetical protein [Planctomycetota bacterium]